MFFLFLCSDRQNNMLLNWSIFLIEVIDNLRVYYKQPITANLS